MYSAVWVDGQRLYKLARAGKEVERPTRQVTIHRLDLLEFDPENRTCVIDVACSKGTYIRTLCHDIGEALGCGGMLTALRRTETLGFTTADCHTLEELKQASEEGRFEELLMPVDAAFRQYKSIFLSPSRAKCSSTASGWIPTASKFPPREIRCGFTATAVFGAGPHRTQHSRIASSSCFTQRRIPIADLP